MPINEMELFCTRHIFYLKLLGLHFPLHFDLELPKQANKQNSSDGQTSWHHTILPNIPCKLNLPQHSPGMVIIGH